MKRHVQGSYVFSALKNRKNESSLSPVSFLPYLCTLLFCFAGSSGNEVMPAVYLLLFLPNSAYLRFWHWGRSFDCWEYQFNELLHWWWSGDAAERQSIWTVFREQCFSLFLWDFAWFLCGKPAQWWWDHLSGYMTVLLQWLAIIRTWFCWKEQRELYWVIPVTQVVLPRVWL